MATIPDEGLHLFENQDVAHLATLNADGAPQVSTVWIGREEDDLVVVVTERSLLKARNMERDGRVAISIAGQENPYETLAMRGKVVELTTEGAEEYIDALTKRYMGKDSYPYRQPGEERVMAKIKLERVRYDVY
jgi:PPOX class probable F420-dependent enzyme